MRWIKKKRYLNESWRCPASYTLIHFSNTNTLSILQLQIGIKCGASLNDINGLISQFENLDITHKVLRYRFKNGLEIPTDEASAKEMMQNDLQRALTPREFKLLRNKQKQQMKASRRRM